MVDRQVDQEVHIADLRLHHLKQEQGQMSQTLREIHHHRRLLRMAAIKMELIQAQIRRHRPHIKIVPTQHTIIPTKLEIHRRLLLQEMIPTKTILIQLAILHRLRTQAIPHKDHRINRHPRMAATRSRTGHHLLDHLHLDQLGLHQVDQVALVVRVHQVDLLASHLIPKTLPILQKVLRHHLLSIDFYKI